MNNTITKLNPQAVWKHFAVICAIPHTTGNEEKLLEYIIGVAKSKKLKCRTDSNGNLLIIKPATKGHERLKGVILQAHLDMAPVKEDGKIFNFEKDHIDAVIDNGWVRAEGTALGANGVGVAAALAVLEATDIKHGPLEVLFTVEEENFHHGVYGLSKDFLSGSILINLDMDEEGKLCLGCAGGTEMTASFKYKEDRNRYDEQRSAIRIEIRGLKGGHSGYDIDKHRANAIKILFRFLYLSMKSFGININFIDAGGIPTAIPREATVVVSGIRKSEEDFLYGLEQFEKIIQEEYKGIEDGISIKGYPCAVPDSAWDKKTMRQLILAVNGCPSGIFRMSPHMQGLVHTSANLGRIISGNGQVVVQLLLRSSSYTEGEAAVNEISSIFELADASVKLDNTYDGWMYNMDSEIYKVMSASYEDLFGEKPKAIAVHAGLECGIISGLYPRLDVISCGPTIKGVHSPSESVNIDSVGKFWNLLEHTLANIPSK